MRWKARHGAGTDARRRTVSIQSSLAIGIAVLVVVTTIVVVVPSLLVGARNTLELLRQRTDLVVESAETRLVEHLRGAERLAADLAAQMAAGRVDTRSNDAMVDAMTLALSGIPQVLVLAFLHPDESGVALARTPAGFEAGVFDGTINPQAREALYSLRNTQGAVWGDLLYIEQEDFTALNLRQPVHAPDGTFLGILVATVDMRTLSRFLSELQRGDQAYTAFVLYGDDLVLAHPRLAEPFHGLSRDHPLPTIPELGDPVLTAWQSRPPGSSESVAGLPMDEVSTGDTDYALVTRRLPGFGGRDLVLGSYATEDLLLREVRRLVASGVFTLVVLLVAVVLALRLARRMARPIREIAAAARQVGALELDQIRPLHGSPITELNEQARAFNTMLATMRWFATYVPRTLVQRLISRGGELAAVSVERELTVLFADIAGFTRTVERLPAAQTAEFLNRLFALLDACIESEGGTIDKYLGDGLMAFWGAPEPFDDHAGRACRAALSIKAQLMADNMTRVKAGRPPVRLRVGLHTGPMVVGNIGAPGRMNYTIVGDAVNTGSRMEQLGKELAPDREVVILVSGTTARGLGGAFTLQPLGQHMVRGRRELIDVFELVDGPHGPPRPPRPPG